MALGINAVFLQLKPICDIIASEPSKEKLIQLQDIIKNSPINIIQQLHEYILFPLVVQLENEKRLSYNVKQELLETLKCLLEIIKLTKINILIQLCIVVSKQIFDKQTSTLIDSVDEEIKLSAITCILLAFKNISIDILTDLYVKKYSIYFSQCIYLNIQLAKNEKLRSLRITAINCLLTLLYSHDEADITDKVLREQVADCMMFYLPGITIALRDIALGDEKQGHKITSLALKALHKIIILHMEDKTINDQNIIIQFPLKQIENTENENKPQIKNIEKMMEKLNSETRDNDWFKKTSENLQKLIETLTPLQYHYHEKVRFELSEFCGQLIKFCSRNLSNVLPVCVEILISLSEDDNLEVCEKSREALKLINFNATFFEILLENFYNVITKLPRIINGTDTQKQLSILNLLVGYLRIFKTTKLSNILQSPNHLNRLLQSLILVAQMEKSNVTLFEEYAIRDFESIAETPITWKHFKFIDEKTLFNKFQNALHLISESDASEIIIDSLIEMFNNQFETRNEIIFLLNEIISVPIKNDERLDVISNILKMYIDEENWYLPIETSEEVPLNEVHNNIVQMCLLVEGLGCISNALQNDFKQFLLKTLYLVLERAGSAQPLLSASGLLTLLKISKSCQYNNVTDLIVQNTDYFSFHVTKRLKKLNLNTGVLNVLNVIMNYSTIEVLPSIMNIVNEVLLNSFDQFQEKNILSFLLVFYSFVKNLKRWMKITVKNENKIINLLNEYKKTMDVLYAMYDNDIDLSDEIMDKTAEELYQEDLQKQEEIENEFYDDNNLENKPELPEHIKLTVCVLKRSLNFLPNKNRDRKLLTLNILREGIEIINSWQDEFLPVVHLIWSPLIERFKEHNEPLIINKSFELLMILARFSKDFIRLRTCKDVLPEICVTLKSLSIKSYLKDRGSAYRYTQEYKLQLMIIPNLAQILSDLEVADEFVELACKNVTPYLSNKQPIPLQESAINFYKTLALYDFDTVWLYLLDILGIKTNENNNNEFRKNIEIILKCLEIIHW